MRNILGKLLAILATLAILFSAAFFTVSLILRDNDAIEKKYQELDVGSMMGMSTPDLAKSTTALIDYMRGERPNIKVSARVNGEILPEVFCHEKEIVHMAEVQELWLALDWFARYGAMGGTVVLLFGFLIMERGKRRAILSSAMFWGCGVFGGILVFFGIWAVLDFQSFWTVFHFIIFPKSLFQYLSAGATLEAMNELNWVLDSDSIMVNMLMPVFPSIVLRCALCVFLEIGFVLLIAVFIRFAWRKEGKPPATADIVVIEHDANEPVPIKGPDLVLAHALRNAPKSKREEIIRRAQNGEPLEDPPKPFKPKPIPPAAAKEPAEEKSAEEPAENKTGEEPSAGDDGDAREARGEASDTELKDPGVPEENETAEDPQ